MGRRLLRVIFSIYFIITLIVTSIQLSMEYLSVKSNLLREVSRLKTTFHSSIATALWEFNKPQLDSILSGLKELSYLVGVKIENEKGEIQSASGLYPKDKNASEVLLKDYSNIFDVSYREDDENHNLIAFKFDVSVVDSFDGSSKKVGQVSFYTAERIVFEQVKGSFFIIFVNSIIKTLALWIVFLLTINRMVEKPLVLFSNIVRQLNPSVPDATSANNHLVPLLNRHDELGDLSLKFVDLIKTIEFNITMINDLNRDLEKKVRERTIELVTKNRDITAILTHMKQGILTFNKSMLIDHEYSKYLETIYGTFHIKGVNVLEFIFSKSQISQQKMLEIKNVIEGSFDEPLMSFDCNSHILPKEFSRFSSDGSEQIIELSWEPIIKSDLTQKIMIIIRDVSLLRQLQKESTEKKNEIESINQILNAGIDESILFVDHVKDTIREDRSLIASSKHYTSEMIAKLFRSIHTIKGNALIIGLRPIGEAAGDVEVLYQKSRQDIKNFSGEEILIAMDYLDQKADFYKHQIDEKFYSYKKDEELLSQVESLIKFHSTQTLSKDWNDLTHMFKHRLMRSLASILSKEIAAAKNIAVSLGKEPPEFVIEDNGIMFQKERTQIFRDVFTHLIRNSIDHGLETKEERLAKNKKTAGKIFVQIFQKESSILIKVEDDGRGLNLKSLRDKGLERELLEPSASLEQIADVLFSSGISTAKQVTDISGRGVGMDAVKSFLENQDASITVSLKTSEYADFAPFYFLITLPYFWASCDNSHQAAA